MGPRGGLVDDDLERASDRDTVRVGNRHGDREELGRVLSDDGDAGVARNLAAVGDGGVNRVVHVDDGDGSSHGNIGVRTDGRSDDDDERVVVARGLDVRGPAGVHLRLLRAHRAGADSRDRRVLVDVRGDRSAHRDLRGTRGKGSGDHARVGADRRGELEVSGDVDRAAVADEGLDVVEAEDHGDAAGHGDLRIAAGDTAGDGLGVVVGRGEEVEQVDGLEDGVRVHLDVDCVGDLPILINDRRDGDDRLVLGLGDVLVGLEALLRGRGDLVEGRPVDGHAVVGEGDHGLLGRPVEALRGDDDVVAN